MHKLFTVFRSWLAERGLLALSILFAALVCCIPLQRFLTLSRYQHYSYVLAVIATGVFLQGTVSWKRLGCWGQCAMISGAVFLGLCAYFFYSNPWLGNPDMATDEQLLGRQHFIALLAAFLVPVSYFWIRYGIANRLPQKQPGNCEERGLK